jgi:hypothetical protein
VLATLLEAEWRATRHGAIAGRGYHYQDAVGAWVAARMLAGVIDVDRLVPEGLEDLSCDGPAPRQIQVKSRQARVGDFPLGDGARHLLDAWQRHAGRSATAPQKLVLVFERPVAGYAPGDWDTPLGVDPAGADLVGEVRRIAARRGLADAELGRLLGQVSVLVLPHRRLRVDAADLIGARTRLPAGATSPVLSALRTAVTEHADRNAGVGWAQRAGLTRTDVERLVTRAAELIDVAALHEAVRSGAAEPVDLDTPLPSSDFYAGAAVQPGHVAAGLVVPRPVVTDEVLAGLDSTGSVLIVGPSGIGKSAVLWMTAYVARHVAWYRVHRLREADAEPVVRLARAAAGDRHAAVGLLVDGVGVGDLTAWDALHRRLAGQPEVLLLGTVREEDLLPLATGSAAVQVRPRLDETVAARIHAALRERGVTSAVHWREAYEAADGLTLEFTHLLAQGRRLGDVVGDQVVDRVRAGRTTELAVLAPVSASDRWGAALSVEALTLLAGGSAPELRAALSRLVDEHVITIRDGSVRGLHPLRSAALCDAVHRVPPPLLASTVCAVIRHLDSAQLTGFVARLLADEPELGPAVVRATADRAGSAGVDQLPVAAAALGGLRLADFSGAARRWTEILQRYEVPRPMRPLAVNLAMIDTELGEWLDSRLVAAVAEIRGTYDGEDSPLRDALVVELGTARLGAALAATADVVRASGLLAALGGSGVALSPDPDSPLGAAVVHVPLTELAELLATADAVGPATGQALLTLAGGEEGIIARLQEAEPWLLDLDLVRDGGETVLNGRLLHVSDRLNSDPHVRIVAIARTGLQCLPGVDRVDLTTVTAAEEPLQAGGFTLGTTRLLRKYALGRTVVAWNRTRARYAGALVAAESTTSRLASGLAVLQRTEQLLGQAAEVWLGQRAGQQLERLSAERQRLATDIQALMPRPIPDPLADPGGQGAGVLEDDPLHTLTDGIVRDLVGGLFRADVRHANLASVARDRLLPTVAELESEPWQVLGLDGAPPVLDHLRTALMQLADVLDELGGGHTTTAALATVTRGWPRADRLRLAARVAAERATARHRACCVALEQQAAERGWQVRALNRPDDRPRGRHWPALYTALLVTLDRIDRLDEPFAGLTELIAASDLPGQTADLLPASSAGVLPRLAARAQLGELYPVPAVADPWLPLLDAPPATPAADAVTTALKALQELSALALLRSRRPAGPEIEATADEAGGQVRHALQVLDSLPPDRATAVLRDAVADAAEQVQAEFAVATAPAPGTFAGALSGGPTTPSDALANAGALLVLATQWDLDQPAALAMLE